MKRNMKRHHERSHFWAGAFLAVAMAALLPTQGKADICTTLEATGQQLKGAADSINYFLPGAVSLVAQFGQQPLQTAIALFQANVQEMQANGCSMAQIMGTNNAPPVVADGSNCPALNSTERALRAAYAQLYGVWLYNSTVSRTPQFRAEARGVYDFLQGIQGLRGLERCH